MKPKTNKGIECLMLLNNIPMNLNFVLLYRFKIKDLEAKRPNENTNEPTPRSINDVPHVSTLANLLGNTGKSTANIATMVATIICDAYTVKNGLCTIKFEASSSSVTFFSLALCGADFFALLETDRLTTSYTSTETTGISTNAINSPVSDAYVVTLNKNNTQFKRKSRSFNRPALFTSSFNLRWKNKYTT